MRLLLIAIIILLSSCSAKYKASHTDYGKFIEDIEYCLKKSCNNKSVLHNLSIISSALAYGGGGGDSFQKDKISYKVFNLCLKKKGYSKDENGVFELPNLTCK